MGCGCRQGDVRGKLRGPDSARFIWHSTFCRGDGQIIQYKINFYAHKINMKQFIKWTALLVLPFFLVACIDLDQKITLIKDQLNYRAELRVDAKVAAFADKKQGGFCGDFGSQQKEGVVVDVQESASGGNIICVITAQGPIDKFKNFSTGEKNKSEMVRITELDGGRYRIDSVIDFQGNSKETMGMDGMLDAMLAGRNISWSVAAPKVLESNGKMADDGKSVTWTVPMSVAFKNPQKFYAVIQKDVSWVDSVIGFFKKIMDAIWGLFKKDAVSAASTPATPVVAPAEPRNVPAKADAPSTPAPVVADNNPFAPSFDCTKASTGQERLICSDRELSKLDVDMASAYANARQKAADVNALKAEQRLWLRNSQKTCSDKDCLVAAYQSRIAELNN